MSKEKYYRLDNIIAKKADYHILFGERSNGKSYAVSERALYEAYTERDFDTGEPINDYEFGYIRRWDMDIKASKIDSYFADKVDLIKKMTNNEYDCVSTYRGIIYLAKIDEKTMKPVRGKRIGVAFALTGATHYKSLQFPKIRNIIFEEFLVQGGYLPEEPKTLQSLISTIARKRKVKVFMIGNTESRICPYIDEWSLVNMLRQKQGTIDVYVFHGEESEIRIACEYCASSDIKGKMFFGQSSKMINGGVWDSNVHQNFIKPFKDMTVLYNILYEYNRFRFIISLVVIDNDLCLAVRRGKDNKDYNKIVRVVSNHFNISPCATLYLTPLLRYDKVVIDLLNNDKIMFSDNLTGTEFYTIKKERGKF